MEYSELTNEERILLVGMMRKVAGADKNFSDEEKAELVKVANLMGEAAFKAAAHEANTHFGSVEAIETLAKSVQRPEARGLILTAVQDLAVADEVAPEEMQLVTWLADLWDL